LLNRSGTHADKARAEIEKLNTGGYTVSIDCDLCSFESVRAAGSLVRKQTDTLDALVLNAGLMAQDDSRTRDGYDIQMQANHLSHFLLTSLLLDLLEKTATGPHGEARIVSHSSGARLGPELYEDSFGKAWATQPDAKPNPRAGDAASMNKWRRYQQSKRANLAFTYALADLLESRGAHGVKALCAHPGATNSGLQSRTQGSTWLDNFINGLAVVCGQSTDDGCLGLALATLKEGVANGDFFGPAAITGNAVLLPSERSAHYGETQLQMLWKKSIDATGARW
jgi:NAD(P)-dependent dehydrogenase (short-subunit alcohol dehydrogenase family)